MTKITATDCVRDGLSPGQEMALLLDSMRFKKLEGENKGGFVLKLCDGDHPASPFSGTAAGVKFAVIRT